MVTRNPKNFEFKLGKQGLLLFVAGMSFLLFAMFIFGVMVGVHIDAYPEKIAQSIPAIIRRQLSHPQVVNEKVTALGEEEKITPQREDGNVVAPPPDSLVTSGDLTAVAVGVGEKKPRLPAPVEPVVDAVAGGSPQASAIAPNAAVHVAPSVAGVKYSVQVGSFKSQEAAKRFSGKITALGFKTRVENVELRNKDRLLRVMVDGFASRSEALQAVGILAKKIKGVNGIIRPVKG